ncbi:SOH1 [Ecytonucleospora hepatopenaei]|uniref:Mediator of RNA polymerase II transcription subunit 31 n=1 Tax=Ecytonucleospora hepatopenaei TaxID=646526 RepID=A0A1W0E6Y5_9MICR|nr:SOH1 [Ecytonucleospora hepatopenaei]
MKGSFQKDLEFLESLTNIEYLKWLRNKEYINNPYFIEYLKKLLIFKKEKYFKFLVYPQSLEILEFIINNQNELNSNDFFEKLEKQQYYLWLYKK